MHINVHLPWWVRRHPETARFMSGGRFFEGLISSLMRRPDINLTVSKKPVRAQHFGADSYCLNYHRSFSRKRNLNIKGAYLPDFFYVDQKGYSGWSEIAAKVFRPTDIDPEAAQEFYKKKLWDTYFKVGISKYSQPNFIPDLPKEYVLVPLQVPGDQVLKLAHFPQEKLLSTLVTSPKMPVVIKIHPMAVRDNPNHTRIVRQLHNPHKGIFVVDGHLHRLIESASAVVCVNSGAGLEAVLLNRPVITCGKSDYHHLTKVIKESENVWSAVMNATAPSEDIMYRYANWFFGDMMIDIRDDPEIWVPEVLRRVGESQF